MSNFTVWGEPFKMDLLNVVGNKVTYEGEEHGDPWDFLNTLLCEGAWACGCGMPDKATNFFIRQFKALATGVDYHTFEGGLDLFKISCYHKGFIDVNGKYTEKGEEFLTLVDYFLINDDVLTEGQIEKLPVPKLLIKGDVDKTIDIVFKDIGTSPDLSNAFLALQYIAFFASFLKLRSEAWDKEKEDGYTGNGSEAITKKYHDFGANRHGEIYNALHILENVLEMEEHGGSTPGWIDPDGYEKLEAIEKLFDRDDFFFFYLKE